jgi:hypothetical protein
VLRFLLSLPFALPQLYHQYLALVWLLIYGGATYAYGALCLGLMILNSDSMIIAVKLIPELMLDRPGITWA